MSIECTDRIPIERFKQWHDIILCSTGGRYITNPIRGVSGVYVVYKPGDHKKQCELYNRITTSIIEVRKDQKWRIFLRKIGIKI